MIKIIREGKKEFTTTCPKCGCEFSYELEDLGMDDGVFLCSEDNKVKCPYCKDWIIHPSQLPKSPYYIYTYTNGGEMETLPDADWKPYPVKNINKVE